MNESRSAAPRPTNFPAAVAFAALILALAVPAWSADESSANRLADAQSAWSSVMARRTRRPQLRPLEPEQLAAERAALTALIEAHEAYDDASWAAAPRRLVTLPDGRRGLPIVESIGHAWRRGYAELGSRAADVVVRRFPTHARSVRAQLRGVSADLAAGDARAAVRRVLAAQRTLADPDGARLATLPNDVVKLGFLVELARCRAVLGEYEAARAALHEEATLAELLPPKSDLVVRRQVERRTELKLLGKPAPALNVRMTIGGADPSADPRPGAFDPAKWKGRVVVMVVLEPGASNGVRELRTAEAARTRLAGRAVEVFGVTAFSPVGPILARSSLVSVEEIAEDEFADRVRIGRSKLELGFPILWVEPDTMSAFGVPAVQDPYLQVSALVVILDREGRVAWVTNRVREPELLLGIVNAIEARPGTGSAGGDGDGE